MRRSSDRDLCFGGANPNVAAADRPSASFGRWSADGSLPVDALRKELCGAGCDPKQPRNLAHARPDAQVAPLFLDHARRLRLHPRPRIGRAQCHSLPPISEAYFAVDEISYILFGSRSRCRPHHLLADVSRTISASQSQRGRDPGCSMPHQKCQHMHVSYEMQVQVVNTSPTALCTPGIWAS